VLTVPPGKVVTYGQVAGCVQEVAFTARQIGVAMRYAPPDVPWQRVVGAGGRLPIAKLSPEMKVRQRDLLVAEGVSFHPRDPDRVDMARSQWLPPDPGGQQDLFAEA
jgi:methylated-DNA-protein-cysteine methyltransferase-like protein